MADMHKFPSLLHGAELIAYQESRARRLAGLRPRSSVPPSSVISTIHATTGFRYVDSTKRLENFMTQFATTRSGPECRVPLGFFRQMPMDFIPMEDEEAGIFPGPARMVSGGSDDSDGSTDSGYASELASPVTPLEFALSQPFYNLGELRKDYVVAVSLHDYSLWLIYNAWDSSYCVDEDELEDGTDMDDDAYFDLSEALALESKRWFRPDYDPCWAQLPGLDGKTLMAKLADNVYTWHFSHSPQPELRMDPIALHLDALIGQPSIMSMTRGKCLQGIAGKTAVVGKFERTGQREALANEAGVDEHLLLL
ncbi:MAG: hypothetical protein M1826_007094 [Phylliscum demangeonii]|nr:MAG: hypothetical protein M1826_007094 [Phylliscum demangeonii]